MNMGGAVLDADTLRKILVPEPAAEIRSVDRIIWRGCWSTLLLGLWGAAAFMLVVGLVAGNPLGPAVGACILIGISAYPWSKLQRGPSRPICVGGWKKLVLGIVGFILQLGILILLEISLSWLWDLFFAAGP